MDNQHETPKTLAGCGPCDCDRITDPVALRAIEESLAKFDEQQEKAEAILKDVDEGRIQFFEKLALLDGGTIALSLTVLLGIFGKNFRPPLYRLFAAWSLLLVSLTASMARNWFSLKRREMFGRYLSSRAMRELLHNQFAEIRKVEHDPAIITHLDAAQHAVADRAQELEKPAKWHIISDWSAWIAIISSSVGFWLLLSFAVAVARTMAAVPLGASKP